MLPRKTFLLFVLASVCVHTGCNETSNVQNTDNNPVESSSESPTLSGSEFLSEESLTDVMTLQKTVDAGNEDESAYQFITVRGRIGVGDLPPFDPTEASFLMSEFIDDKNASEGHDASTCPFCKRRAEKAPKANVVFEQGGSVIKVPASKLFQLAKGDVVQVTGSAKYDEKRNMLRVVAERIHIEK